MKLRERFQGKMKETPAAAGCAPAGSWFSEPPRHAEATGGPDRHQRLAVLDLGRQPDLKVSKWELIVDGAVEEPLRLS